MSRFVWVGGVYVVIGYVGSVVFCVCWCRFRFVCYWGIIGYVVVVW